MPNLRGGNKEQSVKEDDGMKCLIPNSCEDKQLCCAFCKKKRCAERCRDNYEGCRYFDAEKYEREEKTESEHDE